MEGHIPQKESGIWYYKAVCTFLCGWQSLNLRSEENARQEGKIHEMINNSPILPPQHFTHVEGVFKPDELII